MSSEPGFGEFNKKRVTGRPGPPYRNLGGTEPREGRECDIKEEAVKYREATNQSVNRE